MCVPADDEPRASAVLLLCLVGLNYRSKYGRGALPSTHGVPHDSAAKKAKLHTGLFSKSFSASEASFDERSGLDTVFENHRKSLIQHCEQIALRLHFEWINIKIH